MWMIESEIYWSRRNFFSKFYFLFSTLTFGHEISRELYLNRLLKKWISSLNLWKLQKLWNGGAGGGLALRWDFHSLLCDLQSGSFSHLRWKRGKGGRGQEHIWDGAGLYLACTRIKSMWKLQLITGEEREQRRRQKRPMNVHSLMLSPDRQRHPNKSCMEILSVYSLSLFVYFLSVSHTPIS